MRLFLALSILLAGPAVGQEAYRCGNTYSDKPCAGGELVNTAPAVAESNTTTIYRCDPIHANPFWIAKPCSDVAQGLKEIDRARVPMQMDIHQQVEYVNRERAKQKTGTR